MFPASFANGSNSDLPVLLLKRTLEIMVLGDDNFGPFAGDEAVNIMVPE